MNNAIAASTANTANTTPTDSLPRKRKVPRRTPRACKQCRSAKIRCSGSHPCDRCVRRREECKFPSDEPLVSVPESYLRELERRAAENEQPLSTDRLDLERHWRDNGLESPIQPLKSGEGEGGLRSPRSIRPVTAAARSPSIRNPLVGQNALSFIRDTGGRPRYLGPTSTWSFTRRVFALLQPQTPSNIASPPDPVNLDGTAYNFTWKPKTVVDAEDLVNLPPSGYASYLYNTFKFRLAETSGLVDENGFTTGLAAFYSQPLEFAKANHLWFVQYLFVLAFGKAFLATGRSRPDSPPGCEYAKRALSLMAGSAELQVGSVLAIENLALAALYLQSIDIRVSAYQHIGQALRLCFVEGIHREVPASMASPEMEPLRCRRVFCITHMIDSRVSALFGAPTSLCHKEVVVSFPTDEQTSSDTLVLPLLIRLSRLISTMCTTVYATGETLEVDFIENTSTILHELAEVSRDLEEASQGQNLGKTAEVANDLSNTLLAYHHCIVLATRPLIMWLLMCRLSPSTPSPEDIENPIGSLLQTSAQSATTLLNMLHRLSQLDMLETFLPWQLEYAFSATLLLAIMSVIRPSLVPDSTWKTKSDTILQHMLDKGNLVASLRRSELDHLERLLSPLLPNLTPTIQDADAQSGDVATAESDAHMDITRLDMFFDVDFGGINYNDILELAEQFDPGEFALPTT